MYTFTPEEEEELKGIENAINALLSRFEETNDLVDSLKNGFAVATDDEQQQRALSTVALYSVAKNMGINPNELIFNFYRESGRLLRELDQEED